MDSRTPFQTPASIGTAQGLLAVSGFVVLAVVHWSVEPSASSGDWAQYILHAKALLAGRAYTDTGYLFSPLNWSIGPRAYPPGLPLTLVPLVAMGSWAPLLMRLLMVASGALFLLFAYRRLRLEMNAWLASLATLWCGVGLELAFASVSILSDLGFCLLCWVVVQTMDRQGDWTKHRVAMAALAGLAAMSYRVAGIALVGAMVAFLMVNRGVVARSARVVLTVWGGALLVAVAIAPAFVPRQLLAPSLSQMFARATGNIRLLRLTLFDAQLYPASSDVVNDVYHLLASLLFVVGMTVILRRAWRSFMVVFAAVYTLMLLVSPVADGRYFWPLYPLIGAGVLQGLATILTTLRHSAEATVVPVIATACCTILALGVWQAARMRPAAGFSNFPDAVALADFLKAGAERGEVRRVAFINPRVLTLRSGVPAMGLLNARPSAVARELTRHRITHVAFGGLANMSCQTTSMRYVKSAYPESFAHERSFGDIALERFIPPDSATIAHPRVEDAPPEQLGLCQRR